MDRYKKKNLKFMGKGSDVRAAELNAARRSVRQERFSLQRPLEATDVPSESRVPIPGIPKLQSRLAMLQKWKMEKELKKRLEEASKKPVFKCGYVKPQLDATGISRLQESNTGSFNSKGLTPNKSISKALKATRVLPVSKLAEVHHKESSKPEIKKNIPKANQARSIPSIKPQISRPQVNKGKSVPIPKPQMAKPPTSTTIMNKPVSTKSSTLHPPTRQFAAKNTSAPSNLKPQSYTGVKPTNKATSHIKPLGNSVKETKVSNATKILTEKNLGVKEDKKIPSFGIKPTTSLPQRKPLVPKKPKDSCLQFKKTTGVEPPSNKGPKKQDRTPGLVDHPSNKGLNIENKTAFEPSRNKDAKVEKQNGSSSDENLFSSCQLSLIEPEAAPKERSFAPDDFIFTAPKIRNSWVDDEGPFTILNRVMKEMNLKQRTSTPIKEELMKFEETSIETEKSPEKVCNGDSLTAIEDCSSIPNSDSKHIEALTDSPPLKLDEQEKDKESDLLPADHRTPLKELADNCLSLPEDNDRKEAALPETSEDSNNSVFHPPEPVPVVPGRSTRRLASNYWKMSKPSLALISESPEVTPEKPVTHRRTALLKEEGTPRRSARLARKSLMFKDEEDDILNEQECFLDSPSTEAASRMSMCYDFDRLHLEASAEQGKSSGAQSSQANRGKVSLLYTPPRSRSTRCKSLKGDLMSFSPNVE